jgi:hypothetical protein
MKLWKALGLAGLAGVAASGAIIARNQRARTQLTPDEVRRRLHERVEAAEAAEAAGQDPAGVPQDPGSTASSARA